MARDIPENEDDFIRMQQEAIRRVREMQERARRTLENAGMPMSPPMPPPPAPPEADPPGGNAGAPPTVRPAASNSRPADPAPRDPDPPEPAANRAPAGPPPSSPNPISALLNNPLQNVFHLSLDSEQLLLLGLAYMLYRDNADIYLTLALVFILLT